MCFMRVTLKMKDPFLLGEWGNLNVCLLCLMVLHLIKNVEFASKFMRMSKSLKLLHLKWLHLIFTDQFFFFFTGIQVQCLI